MTEISDDDIRMVDMPPSIGERLTKAREAKKLTTADVAVELRLTKTAVEAMEAQQWQKLHGRAYARGYFGNYVQFLGLPQDEMLAAFNNEYSDNQSLLPTYQQENIKNKSFPWLPLLLVFIVVTITWFAYQEWQKTTVDEQQEDVELSSQIDNEQTNTDMFNGSVVEPISKSTTDDISEMSHHMPASANQSLVEVDLFNTAESDVAKITFRSIS